ncbi:PDR/VanB family oxidoreductase [soil metagenome]
MQVVDEAAIASPTAAAATVARSKATQTVRVVGLREEASGVVALELRPADGDVHPFTAGAHLDLALPNALTRSYSLINAPGDRECYRVAVGLGASSRGGSRYVHEKMRLGESLEVSAPRNHFELAPEQSETVLVAGGIGITPLYAMAQVLAERGQAFTMHYASRTPAHAAFLGALKALPGATVVTYFNQGATPQLMDLAAIASGSPADAHLYCCGPSGMLDAFIAATADRNPATVHFEHFAADGAALEAIDSDAFDVVLARSGKQVHVDTGQSILDAVIAAGVDAAFSCREGVCGTCETRVLSGTPVHADSVLTPSEKAAGRSMMICCSRAKGELTLDL